MTTKRLIAAPQNFKGTLSSHEAAEAIAAGANSNSWECDLAPMADGGTGTLDVLGGERHTTTVTGPLGDLVQAQWSLKDNTAIIEMAQASGLVLVGGPEKNDPVKASTRGTGELIAAAISHGATNIIVGVGDSATTDGGLGCVEALEPYDQLKGVTITVLADVKTLFFEAPSVFGPQKGATTPELVATLEERQKKIADQYIKQFGVDVTNIPGAGAAGGLAGGLIAIGARVLPGFNFLAEMVDLRTRIGRSDLVVTGEGELDEKTTLGKVVLGTTIMAIEEKKPVLVVAGMISKLPEAFDRDEVTSVSLVNEFGFERATTDIKSCIQEVVEGYLASKK